MKHIQVLTAVNVVSCCSPSHKKPKELHGRVSLPNDRACWLQTKCDACCWAGWFLAVPERLNATWQLTKYLRGNSYSCVLKLADHLLAFLPGWYGSNVTCTDFLYERFAGLFPWGWNAFHSCFLSGIITQNIYIPEMPAHVSAQFMETCNKFLVFAVWAFWTHLAHKLIWTFIKNKAALLYLKSETLCWFH